MFCQNRFPFYWGRKKALCSALVFGDRFAGERRDWHESVCDRLAYSTARRAGYHVSVHRRAGCHAFAHRRAGYRVSAHLADCRAFAHHLAGCRVSAPCPCRAADRLASLYLACRRLCGRTDEPCRRRDASARSPASGCLRFSVRRAAVGRRRPASDGSAPAPSPAISKKPSTRRSNSVSQRVSSLSPGWVVVRLLHQMNVTDFLRQNAVL